MSDDQPTTRRHHRQTLLECWGDDGQSRVGEATALIVGVGALGCGSAELLARAGVGKLVIIDRDIVERTNLQRQTLYAESDLGRPKVSAAVDRLHAIDAGIEVEPIASHLDSDLAAELVPGVDLILDGTDNFETRYLLNDAAVAYTKPFVYGGAVATRGAVMPVLPGRGPCLRCVAAMLPAPGATCDTAGVLGPAVGWVAARQAALTLRLIVEGADRLPIRLESFDAWEGVGRAIDMASARDPACRCCVGRMFDWLDGSAGAEALALCGRNSVQVMARAGRAYVLDTVAQRLRPFGRVESADGLVRAVVPTDRGEIGLSVFADGRAIIEGTSDPAVAQAVYDRYIGR